MRIRNWSSYVCSSDLTSSRDTAEPNPRPAPREYSSRKYKVTPMEATSRAVIAASTTGEGAYAVADPRPQWGNQRHRHTLRVTGEDEPSGTLSGAHRTAPPTSELQSTIRTS